MKLGIIGGSFNPIHQGHLIMGEIARESLDLDKLVYIPLGQPSHKDPKEIEDPKHRLNMLDLALKDNSRFSVSKVDIERGGTTYTIDTIKDIKKVYPKADLYFLIGGDSLKGLKNWKAIEELSRITSFVLIDRREDLDYIEEEISYLAEKFASKIIRVKSPLIEISSTDIRTRLRMGKSIKYLVPKEVEDYIYKNKLYGVD